MKTRLTYALVCFLLLSASGPAEAAESVEITGRVLDTADEPVAGVKVSSFWLSKDDRWVTRRGVRTDAQGNFKMKEYLSSRARSLMVFDESQEQGAVVTLDAETAGKPILLKLRPTTLVKAAFESKGLGRAIEQTYVSFTAPPAGIAVASHRGAPSLSLRLPPGDYSVRVSGVDCRRVHSRIKLPTESGTLDLGTTDLKPTIIALHYGKEPPAWKVSDARGIDPKTKLADLKGKWVLLEFWGYW